MKVMAVLSGKGGVGKTTTVANLSAALTNEFRRYIIGIDGNVTTPNLGLHLGIFSFPYTLNDVLDERVSIRDAIHICPNGVRIIPAQLSFESTDVDLTRMRDSLNDIDADLVLIDSCPGLGNEIVPTLKITDEALVVTNPEIPAITDALRATEIAAKYDVPTRGIILNRVRGDKYELSVSEVESVFDAPVISVIPEDPDVRKCIFQGNPVVMARPYSPAAIEFKKLAGSLVGDRYRYSRIDKILWTFRNIFQKDDNEWKYQQTPAITKEVPAPKSVAKKPQETKEPKQSEDVISKLAHLRIKKDTAEASLIGLEEKFSQGSVDGDLYTQLKDRYEQELDAHKKEIAEIEAGINK
ncbi:cell division ATPase MinD [archaeon]|nr:cell division ATPase MinD [archaeon]